MSAPASDKQPHINSQWCREWITLLHSARRMIGGAVLACKLSLNLAFVSDQWPRGAE